jgi:hypothetical protein
MQYWGGNHSEYSVPKIRKHHGHSGDVRGIGNEPQRHGDTACWLNTDSEVSEAEVTEKYFLYCGGFQFVWMIYFQQIIAKQSPLLKINS